MAMVTKPKPTAEPPVDRGLLKKLFEAAIKKVTTGDFSPRHFANLVRALQIFVNDPDLLTYEQIEALDKPITTRTASLDTQDLGELIEILTRRHTTRRSGKLPIEPFTFRWLIKQKDLNLPPRVERNLRRLLQGRGLWMGMSVPKKDPPQAT